MYGLSFSHLSNKKPDSVIIAEGSDISVDWKRQSFWFKIEPLLNPMISKPSCSICQSENHSFYIETAAMMHVEKLEIYTFNRCHICESVFITNPVSENQLDQYYTNAYLPYRGEKLGVNMQTLWSGMINS